MQMVEQLINGALLGPVIEKCCQLCLSRFKYTWYHPGFSWLKFAKKYAKDLDEHKFKALKEIHELRDTQAREDDESPAHLLADHILIAILRAFPTTEPALQLAVPTAKMPPLVCIYSAEIARIFRILASTKKDPDFNLTDQLNIASEEEAAFILKQNEALPPKPFVEAEHTPSVTNGEHTQRSAPAIDTTARRSLASSATSESEDDVPPVHTTRGPLSRKRSAELPITSAKHTKVIVTEQSSGMESPIVPKSLPSVKIGDRMPLVSPFNSPHHSIDMDKADNKASTPKPLLNKSAAHLHSSQRFTTPPTADSDLPSKLNPQALSKQESPKLTPSTGLATSQAQDMALEVDQHVLLPSELSDVPDNTAQRTKSQAKKIDTLKDKPSGLTETRKEDDTPKPKPKNNSPPKRGPASARGRPSSAKSNSQGATPILPKPPVQSASKAQGFSVNDAISLDSE